jgi:hypothetical protein
MSQKRKLENKKLLKSHRHVQSIVELILANVSESIDLRMESKDIVLDIVEDAMLESENMKRKRQERKEYIASAQHDLEVIKYRQTGLLSITNSLSGQKYFVRLKHLDLAQLDPVGYCIKSINPGTTKHLYAALRQAMPDIRRSTSIRVWYTDDSGENVSVPANEMPALRLVGKKLFTMKLWDCPAADSQQ